MKRLALVFIVAFSVLAIAQVPGATGSITGTVKDPSGVLIPGVEVTVSRTGSVSRVITDASGSFTLSGLQAGTYTVSAVLPGFRQESASVTLGGGQTLTLGLTLQVQGSNGIVPLPRSPRERPFTITADNQSTQGNSVFYRGNVRMTTDSTLLTADELDFDMATLTADARGNVKIQVLPITARVVPLSRR